MISRFYVIFIFALVFAFVGCATVGKSIISKQEWSANYALEKGVEATSPNMIDGSLSSIGETQVPTGVGSRGATEFTEAFVKFPEEKNIRRIVVHTPNMQNFTVYAVGKDGILKSLGEIKNNKENKVEFIVTTVTDQVKLRVRKTSDDEVYSTGGGRKQLRRGKGKIQEIEIHGMQETVKAPTPTPEQVATAGSPGSTGTEVGGSIATPAPPVPEKPKAPPIAVRLELSKNTYNMAASIPVKMNISIGPEDLVVLADSVTEAMLRTKLTLKDSSGEVIKCAKQPPRLSFPKPYRGTGKEVSVRNAATLDADSSIDVNIPNLLEYYPIDKPGTYTIQINEKLEVHEKFLGSAQTQAEDLERTIRDINSRSNYTAQEKASLIQTLRDEIAEAQKVKGNRYLEVGARGNQIDMVSNILEITIQ